VIKCAQQDLSAKEVANHLQSGKYISRLALKWADRLNCVFYEDMSIKGIKFLDLIKEQLDDLEIESKEQHIDVNFALMSGEFAQLLQDMLTMFGGLAPIEENLEQTTA
nr:recombination-associated protein RdgC [Pseudomonadota bacterium]